MRVTRMGIGRAVVGAMCLALAGAGWAAPPSAGGTVTTAASFVSAFPVFEPYELDRYSLTNGRSLGTLVHFPPLMSPSPAVSTPHLLADGVYMITLDRGPACRSSHGACHPAPRSCLSQVETLNPASGQTRALFSVSGAWRVLDAVPSPDGRSVALVEEVCRSGAPPRLAVRDLGTGRTHLVTDQLSACGLESDVSWDLSSTRLVFAYARHPDLDALPAGCDLATAATDRTTAPSSWTITTVRSSCGFDSGAVDATGIVAIVACSDNDGGLTSALLQYDGRGQVLSRRALDGFDPPQYGLDAQLESDPAAHTVLASEIITDDPDVSDVWTFNGMTLRHVADYFGQAILAEP